MHENTPTKKVVAVGPIHLDVLAYAKPDVHSRSSHLLQGAAYAKRGTVSVYLGGLAYVLTLKLMENHIPTHLVAFMADSPLLDTVRTKLEAHNVSSVIVTADSEALGGYSVHLDAGGKPVSGILADKQKKAVLTTDNFSMAEDNTIAMVADLNMHPSDLATALGQASQAGVPSIVTEPLYEPNSRKINALIGCTYLVLVEDYLPQLLKSLKLNADTPTWLAAQKLNTTIIIIRRGSALSVTTPDGNTDYPITDIPLEVRYSVYFDTLIVEMLTRCIMFNTPPHEGLPHELAQVSKPEAVQYVMNGEPLVNSLAEVQKQGSLDYLTGLYNRKTVAEVIEAQKDAKSIDNFAIFMIDIDNFKRINDTYGHPEGDAAIKWVAQCILDSLRTGDIAGRWGGEEFIVILPDISAKHSQIVADRMREKIKANKAGLMSDVTVSIGVCHGKSKFTSAAVSIADQALYHAKRTGKDKAVLLPF